MAPGEFVSLLGPSGCGKSTLLRIIGGLLTADRGTVQVGGTTPDRARAAKRFGLVPQTPALLPWRTVADNVAPARRGQHPGRLPAAAARRARSPTCWRRSVWAASPPPIRTSCREACSSACRLVRAFALGAPILLMDEPFAALDEITRADMRYLLLDLWERRGAAPRSCSSPTRSPRRWRCRTGSSCWRARPGRIVRVEPIALGRPRTQAVEDGPRFHEHVASLRHALREGHAA